MGFSDSDNSVSDDDRNLAKDFKDSVAFIDENKNPVETVDEIVQCNPSDLCNAQPKPKPQPTEKKQVYRTVATSQSAPGTLGILPRTRTTTDLSNKKVAKRSESPKQKKKHVKDPTTEIENGTQTTALDFDVSRDCILLADSSSGEGPIIIGNPEKFQGNRIHNSPVSQCECVSEMEQYPSESEAECRLHETVLQQCTCVSEPSVTVVEINSESEMTACECDESALESTAAEESAPESVEKKCVQKTKPVRYQPSVSSNRIIPASRRCSFRELEEMTSRGPCARPHTRLCCSCVNRKSSNNSKSKFR